VNFLKIDLKPQFRLLGTAQKKTETTVTRFERLLLNHPESVSIGHPERFLLQTAKAHPSEVSV
jgi:hypothetical protein